MRIKNMSSRRFFNLFILINFFLNLPNFNSLIAHKIEQKQADAPSSQETFLTRGLQKLIGDTREHLLPEDISYLYAFPFSEYKICSNSEGLFFVDAIDDVIKSFLRAGMSWEPTTVEFLKKNIKSGATVLDLGAHIGTHTIVMSQLVGDTGKVFAFEPQKKIFRELVMNLLLNKCNNVIPLRYAIGEENNKKICLVSPVDQNEGARFIEQGNGNGQEQAIMRTLDSFGLTDISFIKIDVENYEYELLQGAQETILRCKPLILIEIQGNHILAERARKDSNFNNEMALRRQKTISLIEKLGYSIVHFNYDDYLAIPLVK